MRSTSAPLFVLSFLTLGTAALAACGGGQPDAQTPTTPAGPASASTADAGVTEAPGAADAGASATAPTPTGPVWRDDATKDQKVAFMKAHVVPPMSKVFQAADAKKYAEFGCKTCHGPQYKEPKDYLPKLTLKDGKITAFADKPQVAKWMAEKVTPAMASAMGQKPYDPQTHQGFGCGGCHTVETK